MELKPKSRAAVLSCTYGQTLCYECAVKLTPAETEHVDNYSYTITWPKLQGNEYWECENSTCTTCSMFAHHIRRDGREECMLCLGTRHPDEVGLNKTWCQWLKGTEQWPSFQQKIHLRETYARRVRTRDAVLAIDKLTLAIQRKATARNAQLRKLAIEASKRELGGGDVQRFAERCQGELIALGKRVKRQRREEH